MKLDQGDSNSSVELKETLKITFQFPATGHFIDFFSVVIRDISCNRTMKVAAMLCHSKSFFFFFFHDGYLRTLYFKCTFSVAEHLFASVVTTEDTLKFALQRFTSDESSLHLRSFPEYKSHPKGNECSNNDTYHRISISVCP